jgi:DNA-binding NtrC family response regulator
MPGLTGLEVLDRLQELELPPWVLMMTAHGSERHAVEAIKRGTFKRAGGNRTRAAKQLGIGRATLHEKLTRYNIHEEETTTR